MQLFAKLSLIAAAATSLTGVLAVPMDSTLETRAAARVITKCTVPNTVALTFDDGPYEYVKDIVNELDAAGANGTFFVNGNNWRCIYDANSQDRLKYAYERGHQHQRSAKIASHTWGHKDLTTLNRDQLNNEMRLVEEALERILGVVPAFMRPPYGNYNNLVLNVAGDRGQTVAIWDFDSEDSIGATPAQSKQKYDNIIARHPSTILALNHDVYETTAHDVVPYAIRKLKAANYKLVTLAECLGEAPYQSVGSPSTPNDSWKC